MKSIKLPNLQQEKVFSVNMNNQTVMFSAVICATFAVCYNAHQKAKWTHKTEVAKKEWDLEQRQLRMEERERPKMQTPPEGRETFMERRTRIAAEKPV